MEEEANKLMEEMNRFEAEIATEVPLVNAGHPDNLRPIIGVNTFHTVQKKLKDDARPKIDNSADVISPLPPPPPQLSHMPPVFPGGMPGVFPSIPPPPPPPPFMIPHQVRGQRMVPPMARLPPPPPPLAAMPICPRPGPVVLSAAPTKYKTSAKKTRVEDKVNEFLMDLKRDEMKEPPPNKPAKNTAKSMAEQVKANTVVSVQPVANDPGVDDLYGQPGQSSKPKKEKKNRKIVRLAGGQSWEDPSLLDWEDDDFRIFCGDLGNDVTDEVLTRAFNKYSSFLKAKVVRDKRTNKTKGFGFVSFKDPQDFIRAMKEMNGRYVGSRPIKLRKSVWRHRSLDVVKKKDKEKAVLISILTGR